MRVVACDDEVLWLENLTPMLQELCQKYDLPLELKLFTDGEQCYEYLLHNDAQLVIMDIFLAQGTGVELVRRLRKQGFGFKLVFLTTSNEFANESYELAASYYLLKPLQSEQLEKALRCCGLLDREEYIVLDTGDAPVRIRPKDIVVVEVQDKYCFIHTLAQTYKVYSSINKISEKLTQKYFLMTYRGVLINMQHVKHMDNKFFLMSNGFKAPIRVRDGAAVRGAYMDWLMDD